MQAEELLCLVVYDKTGKEIIDNYFVEEDIWLDFSNRIGLRIFVGYVALGLEFHRDRGYKEYISYLDATSKPSVTCPNCGEEKDPNDVLITIDDDCYHVREELLKIFKGQFAEIGEALGGYSAYDEVRDIAEA